MCKRTQDVSRRVQSEKRYSGRGAVVWLSCTCAALGGLNAHGVVRPRATCDKPAPTNNKVLGLVGARGICSQ